MTSAGHAASEYSNHPISESHEQGTLAMRESVCAVRLSENGRNGRRRCRVRAGVQMSPVFCHVRSTARKSFGPDGNQLHLASQLRPCPNDGAQFGGKLAAVVVRIGGELNGVWTYRLSVGGCQGRSTSFRRSANSIATGVSTQIFPTFVAVACTPFFVLRRHRDDRLRLTGTIQRPATYRTPRPCSMK